MGWHRKGSLRVSMGWGRQGPHSHSYCAAQDSTGAEVLGPGWLIWLPLTQAVSHPLPMLSTGTPALSYWPIPHTPPKTTTIALLITKGMWEPQTRSPRAGAQQSCFQKPRLPRVQACLQLGGCPLSSHPHSHWVPEAVALLSCY